MEGGLIITLDRNRYGGGNIKIKEKASTPLKLTYSSCQTTICGLNERTINCCLILGLPRDKGRAKINIIANNRMSGIRA